MGSDDDDDDTPSDVVRWCEDLDLDDAWELQRRRARETGVVAAAYSRWRSFVHGALWRTILRDRRALAEARVRHAECLTTLQALRPLARRSAGE